ncbi:MAG: HAD family phosphatase [Myxococcales bacterium]|nr:HAD family phosphatase [Myxococcales bacterium]
MFAATLFDFNGVLVDDEAVHLAAFQEVLAPLGLDVSETEYWERYIGFDDVGAFGAMLSDHGREASPERVRELVERKRPVYLAKAQAGLTLFPGAADCVRSRAKRGPVAVVSGALRDEIELGLALLGVTGLIGFVISAEDTQRCKPDPEGYQQAFARLPGLRREEVLVIEDSVAGIRAAKAAGMVCIAVAHSHPETALAESGADLVLPDLRAVTEEALSDLAGKLHV